MQQDIKMRGKMLIKIRFVVICHNYCFAHNVELHDAIPFQMEGQYMSKSI